ncbi:hypothetical protein NQ318_010561 [Aromia moschata]|uniref:Helix-turn-helix domain-containing protein n=1 Tax=Aromia moschata TaxID=1265417 RepID=A0AAV8XDR9_9CUCU|nr:hypothetical protein NQ318_010561 [Aromia moschata]
MARHSTKPIMIRSTKFDYYTVVDRFLCGCFGATGIVSLSIFIYEVEHNEQLPFLDVLVIRNSENKLEFDVYRKETATLRYIPNDSHHPFQHKMASFNFIIHRLSNFPLSIERFEHEKQLIKNIAKSNGYSVHLIDNLITKHKFKRTLYNSMTFRRDTDNSKFASLEFNFNLLLKMPTWLAKRASRKV